MKEDCLTEPSANIIAVCYNILYQMRRDRVAFKANGFIPDYVNSHRKTIVD